MIGKFWGVGIVALFLVMFVAAAPVWGQDEMTQGSEQDVMQSSEQSTDQESMQPSQQEGMEAEAPAAQEDMQAAEPTREQQGAVQIADAAVCQDVVDRQSVGGGDVFAKESARLYCFTRVLGAIGETSITHNWYYQGTIKASVKLPVRSPDWRTWSSKTMDPSWSGEWMVEILSEDGTPLESIVFFLQ